MKQKRCCLTIFKKGKLFFGFLFLSQENKRYFTYKALFSCIVALHQPQWLRHHQYQQKYQQKHQYKCLVNLLEGDNLKDKNINSYIRTAPKKRSFIQENIHFCHSVLKLKTLRLRSKFVNVESMNSEFRFEL